MDLHALIEGLRQAGVPMTAAEIADLLFMCASPSAASADRPSTSPETGRTPPEHTPGTAEPRPQATGAARDLYDRTDLGSGRGGIQAWVPQGTALPHSLELGRSLRPLKRPWRNGSRRSLDAEETVRRYTDTRQLVPAFSPVPERWFTVHVVMDSAPSMEVWHPTVGEFVRLLEQLGSFRTIRRWNLLLDSDKPLLAGPQARPASFTQLRSHDRRTLVLVISDWHHRAWQHPALWEVLCGWAAAGATVLVNPLPAHLWRRTQMRAPMTLLESTRIGGDNRTLTPLDATAKPGDIAFPALTLSRFSLARWANAFMRGDPTQFDGVVFPQRIPQRWVDLAPQAAAPTDDPAVTVQGFRIRSSPEAYRLAILCAVHPEVSLPVVHLIRQAMVPGAVTADIAAFLTSGLMSRRRSGNGTVRLTFHEAARQELLKDLNAADAWALHRALSSHLAELTGPRLAVTVAHPDGDLAIPEGLQPFAEAKDATLRLLGLGGKPAPAATRPRRGDETARGTATWPGVSPQIRQLAYRTHILNKAEVIARILQANGRGRTIIFTRTKRSVGHIGEDLDLRGFACVSINGDLKQIARERALRAFRSGNIDVLISTDLASEGLTVTDITHVINYDSPEDPEDYLRRISHAGAAGIVVTLTDWEDTPRWRRIDQTLRLNLPDPPETYHTSPWIYTDLDIPSHVTGRLPKAPILDPEQRAELEEVFSRPKPDEWVSRLSPVEKALLERLASGATIAAAATAEFLTVRTANRRIAKLRQRAGVTTTRDLIRKYAARR